MHSSIESSSPDQAGTNWRCSSVRSGGPTDAHPSGASIRRTVRHYSSSRETIVSTLAVLRVFYVQEGHTRRLPSASWRSPLEHRLQEQAISSRPGIAASGTDRTRVVKPNRSFPCDPFKHGSALILVDLRAACSRSITRGDSTCRLSARGRRDECTRPCSAASASPHCYPSRHRAPRHARAIDRLEA